MLRDNDLKISLRASYDAHVDERNDKVQTDWKLAERGTFIDRLGASNCCVLDIGAGTGPDSLVFRELGYRIITSDLSLPMAKHCRGTGLNALQMDYYAIPFPAVTFDAIWSLNTLLHVPLRSLGSVLDELRRVLLDRGLFFLGCYGGSGQEGTFDKDHYEPKRFFSFKTDDDLTRIAADHFDIVDFHTVDIGMNYHFQSLTLRK
jgi:SAM-dependent methyltransferase